MKVSPWPTMKKVPKKSESDDTVENMACGGRLKWLFVNKIRNAQIAIMVMLGLVLVPMALTIWCNTSSHEIEQVSRLALPLRDQLVRRTAARLEDMVQSFYTAMITLAIALQSDLVPNSEVPVSGDLWSGNQVLAALWATKAAYPFLQSTIFVTVDGDICAVITTSVDTQAFVQNNTRNNPLFTGYSRLINVTTGLTYGDMASQSQYWDMRRNPPHLSVINKPNLGSSFGDTAIKPDTYMVLSVRVKGGGPNGNRTDGVVSGIILTSVLSEFIGKLDLMEGYIYAMNTDGLVIAAPPGVCIAVESKNKFLPNFLPASRVNHTVISAIGKYLERTTSIQALLEKDLHASDVKVTGKRYYVDTTAVKWKTFSGVLVIIVPRKSILGAVDDGVKNLAVFLSVLTVGTLTVGHLLVVLLTRYMGRASHLKGELSKEQASKERAESCLATAHIFLKNLSNDLRAPMSAMLLALKIVCASGLEGEDRSLLEQAQSSSSSLQSLVNSILDIAATDRGDLELKTAPLNLFNELLYLVDLFSVETASMGVDVLLDFPIHLPLLMADKKRIHQIFINLMSNCIKFTSQGHVVIRGAVESKLLGVQDENVMGNTRRLQRQTRRTEERGKVFSGNRIAEATPIRSGSSVLGLGQTAHASAAKPPHICIRFNVEDTGKEIPPDHKELLFENFVSAPDNSSRYGGTGVGLGIVRSLVRLMGGDISALDKEGCGAVFSFTLNLPLARDEQSSSSLTAELSSVSPPKPISENYKGQVLLAFAGPMQRDIASSWLLSRGLTVHPQNPSWHEIPVAVDSMLGFLERQDGENTTFARTTEAVGEGGAVGIQQQDTELKGDEGPADSEATSSRRASPRLTSLQAIVIIDTGLMSLSQVDQEDLFTTTELPTFLKRLQRDTGSGGRSVRAQRKLAVVWAIKPLMSAECKAAIRSAGCYMVQKPVVSSRLTSLLDEIFISPPAFDQHSLCGDGSM